MPSPRMRQHYERGTRFLLYPQAPVLAAYQRPELVLISSPLGSVGSGPSDERAYVADAVGKRKPYGFPYLPPWTGPVYKPACPGPNGHFDHLRLDSREFAAAHLFGAVRHTLDVWERYTGRLIPWHFQRDFAQLELIPLLDWDNAQSGYGFVETGWHRSPEGSALRFALSLDTIAHEIGHSILFSEVGIPVSTNRTAQFLAFHEAAADMIALICGMQFNIVLDHVLRSTHGNLYVANEINRIAELSPHEQIRLASNDIRLSDVEDIWLDAEGQWHDPSGRGRHAHDIGLPLLGATFDILVEIYQGMLVDDNLISGSLDCLSRSGEYDAARLRAVATGFDQAYVGRHEAFKKALVYARDYMGFALARVFEDLRPEGLTFARVGTVLLAADREVSGGRYNGLIRDSFTWRDIHLPP